MTSSRQLPPSMVDRLKREIQHLKDENSSALRQAIFLGMTEQQSIAHDERHQRQGQLVRELSLVGDEENGNEDEES